MMFFKSEISSALQRYNKNNLPHLKFCLTQPNIFFFLGNIAFCYYFPTHISVMSRSSKKSRKANKEKYNNKLKRLIKTKQSLNGASRIRQKSNSGLE